MDVKSPNLDKKNIFHAKIKNAHTYQRTFKSILLPPPKIGHGTSH